jgi:hypothetical protein
MTNIKHVAWFDEGRGLGRNFFLIHRQSSLTNPIIISRGYIGFSWYYSCGGRSIVVFVVLVSWRRGIVSRVERRKQKKINNKRKEANALPIRAHRRSVALTTADSES